MSHRDTVFEPPPGFTRARLEPGLAGRRLRGHRARPLRDPVPPRGRPHPVRAPRSSTRFLREVAGCERAVVAGLGDRRAGRADPRPGRRRAASICGLSGGVDSATAAVLVHRAVGDQLTCVLVDHGLMRKDEAEQVVETFREGLGEPLIHVDAARSLPRPARRAVDEPEAKRKIIGEEFIRVFEEEAREARRRRASSSRARSTRT